MKSCLRNSVIMCGMLAVSATIVDCGGSEETLTGEAPATGGSAGTAGGAGSAGSAGASTGGSAGSVGTGGSADGGSANGGSAGSTGTGGDGGSAGIGTGGSGGGSNFSFFVISVDAIKEAGGEEGLGGNLGGLAGADELCRKAAEKVGSVGKTWHAFLSVTDDGTGNPVHAIERIGTGPWYNVNGLLVANDINGLLQLRPDGSTEIVYNDGFQDWPFNRCLTDEYGRCTLSYGDSHDTLTGTGQDGRLFSTDKRYTCEDWTSTGSGTPAIGHSWPRQLNSTKAGDAHWIQTTDHYPKSCGRNINLSNTMENGVGGEGGYGGFYCFAVMP